MAPYALELIQIGVPMRAAFIHRKNAEVPETYLAFEPAGWAGQFSGHAEG